MSFGGVELLRQRPRDRWSRQVAEVAFCSSSWVDQRATSAGLSPQPGTGRPAGQLADLPIYIFVYHVYICVVGQSGLRQKKRETEI